MARTAGALFAPGPRRCDVEAEAQGSSWGRRRRCRRRAAVASLVALASFGCGDVRDAPEMDSAGSEEVGMQGAAAGDVAQLSPSQTDVPSGAKRAPEASFATLDGGQASLSDLRGDVVIANLWGVWCLPCRTELPELAELARQFAGEPVTIVGLAVESGSPEEIREFLDNYGVSYPIWLMGMEDAVSTFGAVGFPHTVIVDRDGWVRRELLGPQTAEFLAAEVEKLLH